MRKTIAALSFLIFCSFYTEAQLNIQLRAQLPYAPVQLANIGGYVDSTGNEYALVGTTTGLSIVDVTNPASLVTKFTVPGVASIWREVKTWQHYAYVTNENGDGLQIINLAYLPDSIQTTQWHGDSTISGSLMTAHALHIDSGFLYLFGCGDGNIGLFHGAAIICDLNADPWNPHYLGHTTDLGSRNASYIHDGYVFNDTLWAGHIYAGQFMVWDCTDKSNPVMLASQTTPTHFTHNTWLSDNRQTLFTTDETSNSFLTAYDVSDLSNISELGRFQTAPGSNSTVHNTHFLNDYAITSWYTEGVVITDVSRPQNPIEVGKYDTYPGSGPAQEGCWGVYPYLPSGNLVASDMENGLFVLTPTYVRGCYLEGAVTDSITNTLLQGVTVHIDSTAISKVTNIQGAYKTGTVTAGTYSVTYSKAGYFPKTITGVALANGVLTTLDVQLLAHRNFILSGVVVDSSTGLPLTVADVWYHNADFEYKTRTDSSGSFSFSGFYDGTYEVTIGKWGYRTNCSIQVVPFNIQPDTSILSRGYYDDFNFDFGWTVTGTSLNSWERAIPVATAYIGQPANPGVDESSDCLDYCYVTDNGGGTAFANDVDNGTTILTSPVFDPTYLVNPVLEYSRWFFNRGGIGTPNDSMVIYLGNGMVEVPVEVLCATACSTVSGTWTPVSVPMSSLLTPTSNMQLRLVIGDYGTDHILEGGFDLFQVIGSLPSGLPGNAELATELAVYPNPSSEQVTISYRLPPGEVQGKMLIHDVSGRVVTREELHSSEGTLVTGDQLAAGMYYARLEVKGRPVRSLPFVIIP